MFICRFRLVPRFPPSLSLHSHVIITQRFSPRATTPSRQCLAVHIPSHTPSSSSIHASERDLSSTDNTQISRDHLSRCVIQDTNEQPFTKYEAEKKHDKDLSSILHALYAHLNTPEFSKLDIPLSSEQVRNIALRARRSGHSFVLDNLSRNILDSSEAVQTELATSLLSIPRLHLNPSLTASLLFCITPNHLSSLSLGTLS